MRTHNLDPVPDADSPRSLVAVLRSRAPGIIGVSMLVGLATYGALSVDTGIYTSRAELRIGVPNVGEPRALPSDVEKEIVAREVRALQSRDLALAVVTDLQLDSATGMAPFIPAPSLSVRLWNSVFPTRETDPAGETQQERVLRRFMRSLRVSSAPDTNRVTVAFSLADRDLAARASNRLVELYTIRSRDRPRVPIAQDLGWLETEIDNRKRELESAEALVAQMNSGATPRSTKERGAIEEAVKAKRTRVESLLASRTAIQARTDALSRSVTIEILSQATPARAMPLSERMVSAGFAAGAGLIIGLLLATALELMRRAKHADAQRVPLAPSTFPGSFVRVHPSGTNAAQSPAAPSRTGIGNPASATLSRPDESIERLGQFIKLRSIGGIVGRLIGNTAAQGGYRSVIVSEAPGQDVREEATDLAAALCAAGKQVALVDWSLDGIGISKGLGIRSTPGFMDLVEDRASFEDVIQRLPDGDAHVLACGAPQAGGNLDTERLNIVLDTLDEVYDHIVVTGSDEAIRVLFLAIGGRFDACITVGDTRPQGRRVEPESETFLGYHVTDIDLIRLETASTERVRSPQRPLRDGNREARI